MLERKPSLPRRNFSVRWSGLWEVPASGDYELLLGADDRARLMLDGQLVLERSVALGMRTTSSTVQLDAGYHAVEVEYGQDGGDAFINLLAAPVGRTPVPLDPYALFPTEPTIGTRTLNGMAWFADKLTRQAWLLFVLGVLWYAIPKQRLRAAWVEFWFPTTTHVTLAVCRIVLAGAWLVFFAKPWDVVALPLTYDPSDIALWVIRGFLMIVPVDVFHTTTFLYSVFVTTTIAGVLSVVGFYTRVSLLVFGLGNCLLIGHLWSYGEWHHPEGLYCVDLPPLDRSRSRVRISGGRRRRDAHEAIQHGTDCQ